jgi:hypothetical protein
MAQPLWVRHTAEQPNKIQLIDIYTYYFSIRDGTVFGYSNDKMRARAVGGLIDERAPRPCNREVMTMMTYLIVCGMLVGLFLLILAYSYLVAVNSENEMPDIDDVDCHREKS